MHIAGLASNRGRNLLNVADREPGGTQVAIVLTDTEDAPVLEGARARAIPTETVVPEDGESRRSHERRILEALSGYDLDLVCLDGYMRILSDTFLEAAPTTLNVHPSLLPSFPGEDAWGEALDAGVSVSGCTIHVVTDATDADGNIVDSEIDAGPIVTQEPVPVYAGDSRSELKERILHRAEFQAYPRAIRWFSEGRVAVNTDQTRVHVDGDVDQAFPVRRVTSTDRKTALRYGENPQQDGALYADYTIEEASVVDAEQHNDGAKALSYNNYNDADAALNLIKEFESPAAAVIKHTNPAGCAIAADLATAYNRALSTDPMSAFGGIVALNRECDRQTASEIVDSFKEVVVAPGYTDEALSVLCERENLRVLSVGQMEERPARLTESWLVGGRLLQERDFQRVTAEDLAVVTDREPTDTQVESMLFAWRVVKHVKSNAILLAQDTETVGVGMGQVSRVDAVRLAAMKAEEHAEGGDASGSVMASDAFFPFPDGVERAADAGVEAVIQPGGSQNDDAVIAAADEHDLAMVFTGSRCFKHD